jgi:hypothetical protein
MSFDYGTVYGDHLVFQGVIDCEPSSQRHMTLIGQWHSSINYSDRDSYLFLRTLISRDPVIRRPRSWTRLEALDWNYLYTKFCADRITGCEDTVVQRSCTKL